MAFTIEDTIAVNFGYIWEITSYLQQVMRMG